MQATTHNRNRKKPIIAFNLMYTVPVDCYKMRIVSMWVIMNTNDKWETAGGRRYMRWGEKESKEMRKSGL